MNFEKNNSYDKHGDYQYFRKIASYRLTVYVMKVYSGEMGSGHYPTITIQNENCLSLDSNYDYSLR